MFHRHPLLSSRQIRLLAVIAFFGQLYFFVPVMTPYLLQRQLSLAQIAGLQTALLLAMLVMEIPTGVLADRLGHVWSYRLALVTLASGEFLFLFARDYWSFLAIQAITGTGYALSSGSVDAILFDALPANDRLLSMQRAKGLLGGAAETGSVVAYSIGGLIAADLTIPRMTIDIVLGAIAVTTAAALAFGLRNPVLPQTHRRPSSRLLLTEAWSSIRASPSLRRLILLAIVTNAFSAHLLVFYQAYFVQNGVPGLWLGLGLSLASIAVVVTQLLGWRLTHTLGTKRALTIATLLPGFLYLAMAANRLAWLAVILFIVQWGAIHLSIPLFSGLYNIHISDHTRATALSLISAITTLYIALVGLVLGELAEHSLTMTFALLGAVILVGGVLCRADERVSGTREMETTTG